MQAPLSRGYITLIIPRHGFSGGVWAFVRPFARITPIFFRGNTQGAPLPGAGPSPPSSGGNSRPPFAHVYASFFLGEHLSHHRMREGPSPFYMGNMPVGALKPGLGPCPRTSRPWSPLGGFQFRASLPDIPGQARPTKQSQPASKHVSASMAKYGVCVGTRACAWGMRRNQRERMTRLSVVGFRPTRHLSDADCQTLRLIPTRGVHQR